MSLPAEWIDRIFTKLTLAYGRDFLSRWEGVALADVKADWAHELAGYQYAPEVIAFVLEHLPAGKPPTVYDFRLMCTNAPRKTENQLEYRADPARVAEQIKKLKEARKAANGQIDTKVWARRLKARHEAGERLGLAQIAAYQSALGLGGRQETKEERKQRLES